MICTDCQEPIIESERPAAVACSECGAMMHGECRLSDISTASDYCEPCYYDTGKRVDPQEGTAYKKLVDAGRAAAQREIEAVRERMRKKHALVPS